MKKVIRFTLETMTQAIINVSKFFVLLITIAFSIIPLLATGLIVYCLATFCMSLGIIYVTGFISMLGYTVFVLFIREKQYPKDVIDCGVVLWMAACWLGTLLFLLGSRLSIKIKQYLSSFKNWLYETKN